MKKFCTIDCETDPFKFKAVIKPFLWGFYDGKKFKYFEKTSDFIEHIKNFDGIAYAHNGGKFDFFFLLEALEADTKIMIINGRIAKMQIGKCELRDSWLVLPCALSVYQKDEIDYNLFEADKRGNHMKEIIDYLKGDCVYLYNLLEVQFSEYGQKLTLAGSAFDFYFKEFAQNDRPKSYLPFFNKFRPFYYGGRVECFKKGIIKGEYSVFDINSAYPYAMTFKHAYGTSYKVSKKPPSNREEYQRAFFKVIATSKGALPFRTQKGSLIFPNDNEKREFLVSGWELETGLRLGCVEIHEYLEVYEFLETISFENYVNYFFKLKAKMKGVDKARYLLSKLYLNSLYGKFGQSALKHKQYMLIEPFYIKDYIIDGFNFEGELGNVALMSNPLAEDELKFYNVITSASITGFVRAFLFEHIHNAEDVIYCDTDSITCKKFFGIEGEKLGEWEKEGDFDKIAIGGKKLYAFKYKNQNKYKISSKGVKLNHKEIFSIARGKKVCYKNSAPTFSLHKKEPIYIEREIKLT